MTHEDQAMLVAYTPLGRHYIIAAIGDELLKGIDRHGPDDMDWPSGELGVPGLYVWEGSTEDDHGWLGYASGTFRPAVLGDFALFSLPTPLPRVPEGVPA